MPGPKLLSNLFAWISEKGETGHYLSDNNAASALLESCLACLQVGQTGESEEWTLIYQLSNEPDARSMEVPSLSPYTYYRWVLPKNGRVDECW